MVRQRKPIELTEKDRLLLPTLQKLLDKGVSLRGIYGLLTVDTVDMNGDYKNPRIIPYKGHGILPPTYLS